MNKVDFRVYDKVTQSIVNVVSINFHTGSLRIESTDDSGMVEIRHLEDIELESDITTRDKDLSMQALMDLPIDTLASMANRLLFNNTLRLRDSDFNQKTIDNLSNSITSIQTVLDKEIEKSYNDYTKTDNETYYTKWLTLVGFKEMVKEYLGKGVN